MLQIFLIILPLFLIIFLGGVLAYFRIADKYWESVLNKVAANIGLPALVFSSILKINTAISENFLLILANSVFLILIFLSVFLFKKIFRLSSKFFRTIFICMAFGNIGYLGIPVVEQILGRNFLGETSLVIAVYLFWIFTVGIVVLEYSAHKKVFFKDVLVNLLKNPLLLSVFFGLVVIFFEIKIPEVFIKTVDLLANSVTATVLIVIGLFIINISKGTLKEWLKTIIFSLITLFLLPLIFFGGLKFFDLEVDFFQTSIIEAAMPLAIAPLALAEKYKLDKDFIARSIIFSTIFSIFSIPFWIYFI